MGIQAREILERFQASAGGDQTQEGRAEHVPAVSRSFRRWPSGWDHFPHQGKSNPKKRENGTQKADFSFQDYGNEAARMHFTLHDHSLPGADA